MFDKKVDLLIKRINKFNEEKNFVVNFLNIILNIAFVISIIGALGFPLFLLFPPYLITSCHISVKSIFFVEINTLLIMLVIYELKNIVGRIKEDKVFLVENANGFVKIGVYTFLFGVVRQVNYIINGHYGMLFKFDSDGNLRIDIFIFIMVACICFVIAEVLKKAIKIKNENDLTI